MVIRLARSRLVRCLLAVVAWLVVCESQASAAVQIYNPSRYEVWVAWGSYRNSSIAGLDGGYSDPNWGLYANAWFKLPAGGTLDAPQGYGAYIRVVASVNGQHHAIQPEKQLKTTYFPMSRSGRGEVSAHASPNDPNAKQKIEQAGHAAEEFYPLDAFKVLPDGQPYVVLGNNGPRVELEHAQGYRLLGVLAITNEAQGNVGFAFRWSPRAPWEQVNLGPGQPWLRATNSQNLRPEISYDEGINIAGNQTRTRQLRAFDVRIESPTDEPGIDQASQYRLVPQGNRLQVYER